MLLSIQIVYTTFSIINEDTDYKLSKPLIEFANQEKDVLKRDNTYVIKDQIEDIVNERTDIDDDEIIDVGTDEGNVMFSNVGTDGSLETCMHVENLGIVKSMNVVENDESLETFMNVETDESLEKFSNVKTDRSLNTHMDVVENEKSKNIETNERIKENFNIRTNKKENIKINEDLNKCQAIFKRRRKFNNLNSKTSASTNTSHTYNNSSNTNKRSLNNSSNTYNNSSHTYNTSTNTYNTFTSSNKTIPYIKIPTISYKSRIPTNLLSTFHQLTYFISKELSLSVKLPQKSNFNVPATCVGCLNCIYHRNNKSKIIKPVAIRLKPNKNSVFIYHLMMSSIGYKSDEKDCECIKTYLNKDYKSVDNDIKGDSNTKSDLRDGSNIKSDLRDGSNTKSDLRDGSNIKSDLRDGSNIKSDLSKSINENNINFTEMSLRTNTSIDNATTPSDMTNNINIYNTTDLEDPSFNTATTSNSHLNMHSTSVNTHNNVPTFVNTTSANTHTNIPSTSLNTSNTNTPSTYVNTHNNIIPSTFNTNIPPTSSIMSNIPSSSSNITSLDISYLKNRKIIIKKLNTTINSIKIQREILSKLTRIPRRLKIPSSHIYFNLYIDLNHLLCRLINITSYIRYLHLHMKNHVVDKLMINMEQICMFRFSFKCRRVLDQIESVFCDLGCGNVNYKTGGNNLCSNNLSGDNVSNNVVDNMISSNNVINNVTDNQNVDNNVTDNSMNNSQNYKNNLNKTSKTLNNNKNSNTINLRRDVVSNNTLYNNIMFNAVDKEFYCSMHQLYLSGLAFVTLCNTCFYSIQKNYQLLINYNE